jgi:DNA topoisomerase-1
MAHARRRPQPPLRIVTDPVESARFAGLRYVTPELPGIRRRRAGKGFAYYNPDGSLLRDRAALARIRALALPPAWRSVWICARPDGHLQAVGVDARGRKQYRYHARWREVRDETKYNRMVLFGSLLPRVRERVEAHLALPGLPREKVLATVLRLLEATLIRVGNEEYARANRSFGLTTLQNRHVEIHGARVMFSFRGKSGVRHTIPLRDRRLARILARCRDLPGYELFQYVDVDGSLQRVDSADVNAYLRELSGEDFTAKDFRTWAGTVLAAAALRELPVDGPDAERKRLVAGAIAQVAERLGNTPSVCRKCYVHPEVIGAYLDGSLASLRREGEVDAAVAGALRADEGAVLRLLEARLAGGAARAAA